jgi:hypothetical protein
MANRYPLIVDSTDSNKIKELPSGDNLNLTGSSVSSVLNITATGVVTAPSVVVDSATVGGATIKNVATTANYTDLNNRPTALSDFTNDINAVSSGANVSILTNDAGYLTTVSFANLTSKPTTLAGYGITDALTTGSNNSLLVNDAGYITASDLQNGVITVDVNNTGDLVGSVFADDSTVMIDSILAAVNLDGTVRGNVIPNNNGVHNIGSDSNKFNIITATTVTGKIEATTGSAPTANADPGNTGEIRYDDSFIYIKTASGWKKAALSAIV